MDDAKKQLADKLKSSNNILVTVSRNPSVDQLASCIGLTLLLNKQGKHAAAVFSGKVPSTLEFLQPEITLEKNTDSLRDFIIALDKSKADKLRYKVENDVVRIFITPYKTSLSETDLEFTQGDFNVDVVVALGVHLQEDLDQAITTHGRILHDATVASINVSSDGGLGAINWHDPQASSLSELVTGLAQTLNGDLLDSQIATALLTGIVSETNRFSNDKTSSLTMSASAALMAAGANQQLVATKLETAPELPGSLENEGPSGGQPDDSSLLPNDQPSDSGDGVIEIDHNEQNNQESDQNPEVDQTLMSDTPKDISNTDSTPLSGDALMGDQLPPPLEMPDGPVSAISNGSRLMTEPPTMGGTLTANSRSETLDPVTDPLSLPNVEPPQLLDRKNETVPGFIPPPPPPTWTPPPVQPPSPPADSPPPVVQGQNQTNDIVAGRT